MSAKKNSNYKNEESFCAVRYNLRFLLNNFNTYALTTSFKRKHGFVRCLSFDHKAKSFENIGHARDDIKTSA